MDDERSVWVRDFIVAEMRIARELAAEVAVIKKRLAILRETAPGLKSEAYSNAYDDVCQELANPL
jgi:hypothetical protein